jgi:elongation factor G
LSAIANGIHIALARGPILGYTCTDLQVTLDSYYITSSSAVGAAQSCATRLTTTILRTAAEEQVAVLLEPVMIIEVSVGSTYIGDVVTDLTSRRRGNVRNVDNSQSAQDRRTHVIAEVPLADILGYANSLRSYSAGTGNFTMEFLTYQSVPSYLLEKLISSPP